jgi:hypothetical protein
MKSEPEDRNAARQFLLVGLVDRRLFHASREFPRLCDALLSLAWLSLIDYRL